MRSFTLSNPSRELSIYWHGLPVRILAIPESGKFSTTHPMFDVFQIYPLLREPFFRLQSGETFLGHYLLTKFNYKFCFTFYPFTGRYFRYPNTFLPREWKSSVDREVHIFYYSAECSKSNRKLEGKTFPTRILISKLTTTTQGRARAHRNSNGNGSNRAQSFVSAQVLSIFFAFLISPESNELHPGKFCTMTMIKLSMEFARFECVPFPLCRWCCCYCTTSGRLILE